MKGTERGNEMKKTLAILLSLALIVCMMPMSVFAEGEAPTPTEITTNMVSLSKTTQEVYNGKAHTLPTVTVTGVDAAKYTTAWKKVTVDSNGNETESEVTGDSVTDAGTYRVTITGKTDYTGTVKKDFVIAPYDLSKVNILIDNQVTAPGGSTMAYNAVKYYYNGNPIADADVEAVFKDAIRIALTPNADSTRYTAAFSINDALKGNFSGSIRSTGFSIVKNIAADTVKIKTVNGSAELAKIPGGAYDGKAKKVEDLFALYDGSTKLVYGKDYSLSYTDAKNVGDQTVTINGIGTYGSSRNAILAIDPRNATTYVKADAIADQTLSSQNNVEPVLRDTNLNVTLKKGTDYVADVITGAPGGKGSVIVNFIGNYAGNPLTIEYNVVSDEKNVENSNILVYYGTTDITSGSLNASAFLYNGSYLPLSNIVVYKDAAAYNAKTALSSTYYSLSYEYTDKDGKTITSASPIEAQTYRVYLVGKNGYAGKRYLGTYTIPKYNTSNVTVSVSMANAASAPTVTVKSKYENITFTKDKDYTFTYYVNTTTGKVFVTVTPTLYGNLTGTSISDNYPIVAKSITSCTATFTNGKNSVAYTGYTIPVDVTVKDGYYTTLAKGTHYKVTYKDAAGKTVTYIKDAGVYTVEITGIGVYTGKLTLTFTVTGNDISGYTVTLKESSVNVSDKAQTPVIESVKKGTTTLASTNYTVSYQDAAGKTVTSMKDPGTYKVVVTGKGAYSGSAYAIFRIVGLTQTVTTEKSTYKVYRSSDAFNIEAESNVANAAITYTSSNPSVANVSATGTVTVNKVGRAVITISAPATGKYEVASTSVVVKVYPKKGAMSRSLWTDGKKGQIKVRWYYQDGATKYQIRYSRNKNFSTYYTKNATPYGNEKYVTNTATIKNLKSKTRYYVKVRAVYTDDATGEIYYGAWSGYRTIMTK